VADNLYPITVPKWGIEMQEGTITGWQVAVGAEVSKGDELIDIETDKIVNTMEAPVSGVVCRQLVEEGETLKVGELLGVIATGETEDADIDSFVRDFVPADASFGIDDDAPTQDVPVLAGETAAPSEIKVSPVARRLAEKLGVDLTQVKGTGRNGRISKEDVEAAAGGGDTSQDVVPMSSRRQTIARRLTAAKQDIPHYYLTRSIAAEHMLAKKTDEVSLNALLLKGVAEAMAEHPGVNCHVLDEGISQRSTIDINMAVDTDQGLSAPLLSNVDQVSLADLTAAAAALATKARDNKLAAEDLEPGGFTVSNLGALGIESFTAIINPPQAAILAVGTITDGHMKVTMSADHRVIDGADGARFLQTLADKLQTVGN
jgi:pyruvate dehydrogenase E2 component (dihydrolipoamide acetyltransferase)